MFEPDGTYWLCNVVTGDETWICLRHPQQGWKWTLTCGASTRFSEQKWTFFLKNISTQMVLLLSTLCLKKKKINDQNDFSHGHPVLAWPERAKAFFCMIQKQDQVLDHSPTALNLSIVTWDFVCGWGGGGGGGGCYCSVVCFFVLQNWRNGWQERSLTRPRTSQKLSVQSSVY